MILNRDTLLHPLFPAVLLLVYAFFGWGSHPLPVSMPVTLILVFWMLLAAARYFLRAPRE